VYMLIKAQKYDGNIFDENGKLRRRIIMGIQIFGAAKCFDTKKADRFFKERNIKFQAVDLFNTD
jgi:hypothetical protein